MFLEDSPGDKYHGLRQDSIQADSDSPVFGDRTASSPFILKLPDYPEPDQSSVFPDVSVHDELQEHATKQFRPIEFGDVDASWSVLEKPPPQIQKPRAPKVSKVSRHGKKYASVPSTVVRSVALSVAKSLGLKTARLGKDILSALTEASDKFFEQLSNDLTLMSQHAGRKTIDESDVITLMKRSGRRTSNKNVSLTVFRQRNVSIRSTPFSLAARHLPGELQRDVRAPVLRPIKKRRTRLSPKQRKGTKSSN